MSDISPPMGQRPDHPDANGLAALPYCVARITTGVAGHPSAQANGTGFFYRFVVHGKDVVTLVSNKHVLCNRPWVEFALAERDSDGRRALKPGEPVRVRAGELPIIEHPDADVDLALMPIQPIAPMLEQQGRQLFVLVLSDSMMISEDRVEHLCAATEVLMVGFPNGLMDHQNNLPVVRKGSLATPYRADYEGRPNFVVDIAAFGGSSGSPVFAFFNGLEPTAMGWQMGGQSFYLIGVLHSGPVLSAQGKVIERPVPTEAVSITQQMIHLGYCAKISLLRDFIPLLEPLVEREQAADAGGSPQ